MSSRWPARARHRCVRSRRTSASRRPACTAGSRSPTAKTVSTGPACASGGGCRRAAARSTQADQTPRARGRGDAPRGRVPVPGRQPKMMYPMILDLADDGVPVTVTCRVLEFSTQAICKWRKAPVSQRDWDDAHLINAARDIHAGDPAFGSTNPPAPPKAPKRKNPGPKAGPGLFVCPATSHCRADRI